MDFTNFTFTFNDPDGKFRYGKVLKVNMLASENEKSITFSIPHTERSDATRNPKVYENAGICCRAHKDGVKYRIMTDINIKLDVLSENDIDAKVCAFRNALRTVRTIKGDC